MADSPKPFSEKLSPKLMAVLLLLWLLVAGLMTFSRLTHPAFGVQGDLSLHYYILQSYAQSFAEADWWPHWTGLLDGGRGDALFTFYPPLCYFVGAVLMKLFRLDVLTSIKAITFLTFLIAPASAYALGREFFSRRKALLVSLGYVLLPAYPLICLHRVFLANALALSLMPLVLMATHRLLGGKEDRLKSLPLFALSFSAIILTHAITTYLCGVAIGLMVMAWLPRAGWRGVLRLVGAGGATLALVAFFLVPQLVEANWVQLKLQIVQQDYRNYFLFARPLGTGRYRQAWANVNDFTSYLTLAQTGAALLLALLCYPAWRRHRLSPLVWFGSLMAGFGLLISLPVSDLLWRYLPGLKFIQFHWRFQPFVALGCVLLAATAVECWALMRRRPRILLMACLTWLVLANAIFTFMIARLDEKKVTREQVASLFDPPDPRIVTIEEGKRLQDEDDLKYMPYSANQIYFRPPGADFNLYPPAKAPGGLTVIDGAARVEIKRLEIAHREFVVDVDQPKQARIETYNYPHWLAELDGHQIEIKSEPKTGLMLIDLPAGKHYLNLQFAVRNLPERLARVVSIVAWLMLAAWLIFKTSLRIRSRQR